MRAERHYEMKGESGRQLRLTCREVLDRGNHEVEVIGLVLEAEAAVVFERGRDRGMTRREAPREVAEKRRGLREARPARSASNQLRCSG